jgi:hypothetical protein
MSENTNIVEMHGCLICGRVFNVLAVYSLQGRLLDCSVTGPGGHCLPEEKQPLVVCDTHTTDQIDISYKRWLSRKIDAPDEK